MLHSAMQIVKFFGSTTGHEFVGRNTFQGALQLSVREMRSITTDLSCPEHAPGCMVVGPGVYWIEAYKAVSNM